MFSLYRKLGKSYATYNKTIIDSSTIKVVVLASLTIIVSILLTGGISYYIAKEAIIQKLKNKDLIFVAQSITAKIDARIDRAKETSLQLSRDPIIIKWLQEEEKDKALGEYSKQKITNVATQYDYSNSFIVSSLTNHYWAESGRLIDTLSSNDTDDSWFFNIIKSKNLIDVIIDFNKERNDSFVFINVLIGDINKPIGVTGVGLDLKEISQEFKSYKFGEHSNMWLIDNHGYIYLSEDIEQCGQNIANFINKSARDRIIEGKESQALRQDVFEYKNSDDQLYDVICQPLKSTQWKLVFQIPRSESISVINSIKLNTAIVSIITIIIIVFLFYLVSNKIANPYKRAIILNQELEKMVNERTKELNEKNKKIMDSIEYAKFIQQAILPPLEELNSVFREHFLIWKPRDIVGGDFYVVKRLTHGIIVVVGDCTGHGVPGALMTMTVNSILSNIIESICSDNPALILKEMNLRLKQTLYRRSSENIIDDGLEAGIIYISSDRKLCYAGAKTLLYKKDKDGLTCFKGNRKGIGYRNTSDSYEFNNFQLDLKGDEVFYITTDGLIDQNGGEKDLPFGRKRLEKVIHKNCGESLKNQLVFFEEELKSYMGSEEQRDDITFIAFKV